MDRLTGTDNISLCLRLDAISVQLRAPENPLLIEEIVDEVLSYLPVAELISCFDVCQLWRRLTPAHSLRLRPSRPPVLIKGDMTDPDSSAYLDSIRKHPSFKATKFSFRGADLGSAAVQELLERNGADIEQLELCYRSSDQQTLSTTSNQFPESEPCCPEALGDLLLRQTPALKTLVVTELPPSIIQVPTSRLSIHTPNPALTLTKIKISLSYIARGCGGYDFQFLVDLFTPCQQLEALTITDWTKNMLELSDVQKIIGALISVNRLRQIRDLEIDHVNYDMLRTLSTGLAPDQLRSLMIKTSVDPAGHGNPDALQQILEGQRNSLETLQVPINRSCHVTLPPMPRLEELRISKAPPPQGPFAEEGEPPQGSLNYATNFPRLRFLGLKGYLFQYVQDEIYPHPGGRLPPPSYSVQVLHEIPLGVDHVLMARIGRLFPNLSIIRTPIPYAHELLLISIWEFCPNVTELFLTLDDDDASWRQRAEGQNRAGLDSIFSGIPEPDCKRLRELPADQRVQELTTTTTDFEDLRAEAPSICDLKKLRRLVIDGPAKTLQAQGCSGRRVDKLSDVFGYSTLAAMALGPSSELCFVQIRLGLIKLTVPCVDYICGSGGLQRELPGSPGFDPGAGRLIRPGCGLETLGPVPAEWYGVK